MAAHASYGSFGGRPAGDADDGVDAEAPGQRRRPSVSLFLFAAALFLVVAIITARSSSARVGDANAMLASPIRHHEHHAHHSKTPRCKSLLLLRHAKSSWKNSHVIDDFDRPLSAKGRRVAGSVGDSLRERNVELPDMILSSPSARTKETLDLVLRGWLEPSERGTDRHHHGCHRAKRGAPKMRYDGALYDLASERYLDHLINVLGKHNNNWSRVMVVGHNPAMEGLLNDLLVRSGDDSSEGVHFSPGALYELRFTNRTGWDDLVGVGERILQLP